MRHFWDLLEGLFGEGDKSSSMALVKTMEPPAKNTKTGTDLYSKHG